MVALLSGTSWFIWQCKCLSIGSAIKPWFAPGQLPYLMGRLLWKDFKELKDTNEYSSGEQASSLAKVQHNSVRTLCIKIASTSHCTWCKWSQKLPSSKMVTAANQHLHTRQVITSRGVSFCCQVAALKTAAKVTLDHLDISFPIVQV